MCAWINLYKTQRISKNIKYLLQAFSIPEFYYDFYFNWICRKALALQNPQTMLVTDRTINVKVGLHLLTKLEIRILQVIF